MKKLILAALLLMICSALFAGIEPLANVMDFGAKGDGKTDDTKAFEKAIAVSAEKKIPVFVPRGDYRLTDTLYLEHQSMKGGEPGGWNDDSIPMPKLIIDHQKSSGIIMKDGSSIYGLALVYDEKKLDVHFPPAILMSGVGVNIQNLRLQYCWDGIACHPRHGAGRVNIENVFIVSCGGCGVYITGTLDIPTIRNIEVWNNLHRPDVVAFRFGYNDGISCYRLFSMSNHTGFQTVDPPKEWRDGKTGSWGTFVDCATDATSISWDIQGTAQHNLGITGGLYWGHHKFLQCSNPNADAVASGCQVQDNGAPAIDMVNGGNIIVSGCKFVRAMECKSPFINAVKGKSLNVSGCYFSDQSPVLNIGKDMELFSFTGNIMKPSDYPFIVKDDRGKNSAITIANNTGKTE